MFDMQLVTDPALYRGLSVHCHDILVSRITISDKNTLIRVQKIPLSACILVSDWYPYKSLIIVSLSYQGMRERRERIRYQKREIFIKLSDGSTKWSDGSTNQGV